MIRIPKIRFLPKLSFKMGDVIAGVSTAALLLPQVLAYSGIANLPPQAGLFALFAGLLCYGLLGLSRFAVVSPTSSAAVVLATATASLTEVNPEIRLVFASALIIVTGVIFIIASIARLGTITDFIAKPVLRGFTFGLAIYIIIKQFISVLHIQTTHTNLFLLIYDAVTQVAIWDWPCIWITLIAVFLFIIGEWFRRIKNGRFMNFPAGATLIVIGIWTSYWFNLPEYGIPIVGDINLGLNNIAFPDLPLSDWLQLIEVGAALVFILYAESYGSIQSFALKHNDETSPNRDLLALGVANIVSGLCQGMPVGAGYSATAAHEAYGAKTRLAGLYAFIVTVAILATSLSFIAWLPLPILAAIVIGTMGLGLNARSFRLYFGWRVGRLLFITSISCVLILGVLEGLLSAIVITILLTLKQSSRASIETLGKLGDSHDYVTMHLFPNSRPIDHILILRPEQSMFFANAERIVAQMRLRLRQEKRRIDCVVISLENTTSIDATSLEAIRNFLEELLAQNKLVIFARVQNAVYIKLRIALWHYSDRAYFSRLSVSRAVEFATRKLQNDASSAEVYRDEWANIPDIL